jgi:hypothetical protein
MIVLLSFNSYQNNLEQIQESSIIRGEKNDLARIVRFDNQNNFIIAGMTDSPDFNTKDAMFPSKIGREDIFISKYSSDSKLMFSTFFGGKKDDQIRDIAIDQADDIILVGETYSDNDDDNFPITHGLHDSSMDGENDAFVSKITADGDLNWSTYVGGFNYDFATSTQVDSQGDILVSGYTSSSEDSFLPGESRNVEPRAIHHGVYDAFLFKMNSQGEIQWNNFVGGSDIDLGYDIAIDSQDFIYLVGYSISLDFKPTIGGLTNNSRNAFLIKFNRTGNILWSKIIGEISEYDREIEFEEKISVVVDSDDNVIVGGWSNSQKFKSHAEDDTYGDKDGFLIKLDQNGDEIWNILLSGNDDERITDIEVDTSNNIYVVGETTSYNFPLIGPLFYSYQGFGDAFLSMLDPNGIIVFSTYLGGTFWDGALGIDLDDQNNVIIAGFTSSTDYYTTQRKSISEYVDSLSMGYIDAFFVRFKNIVNFDEAELSGIEKISQWGAIFIENTSIFEFIMILGAILFSVRTISYYRKTRIGEYLLFAGIFISMALNPILQVLVIKLGQMIPESSNFVTFVRQPQMGLILTWILLLFHSIRLKWETIPQRIKITSLLLFVIKLISPLFIILIRENERVQSYSFIPFLLTIVFLLFDLFVILLLLQGYITIDLINPTKRIKKAYILWIIAWVLFAVGFILVLILTGSQIYLLSVGTDLNSNLSIVISYRTLNAFLNSGIYFFIVFIIIGIIAILYPEGVLLSHAQFSIALSVYEAYQVKVGISSFQDKNELLYPTQNELIAYIEATKLIIQKDEN